jgi:hypothetical protein
MANAYGIEVMKAISGLNRAKIGGNKSCPQAPASAPRSFGP